MRRGKGQAPWKAGRSQRDPAGHGAPEQSLRQVWSTGSCAKGWGSSGNSTLPWCAVEQPEQESQPAAPLQNSLGKEWLWGKGRYPGRIWDIHCRDNGEDSIGAPHVGKALEVLIKGSVCKESHT